jgi:protocatechuate 3,4-dioxygenase beta subunit
MAQNSNTAPPLLDLTIDNITPNTVRINSQSGRPRLTYLMERLVTHLHDFARETRLSTDEWMAALKFLVECGQISSDVRQEFILLSDVLGLSLLVDAINHPKPPSSTEGSVLGPFHTHDAPTLPSGSSMTSDPQGEPLLVLCTVKDTSGNPVQDVKIDIWETDSSGHYDVQHTDRDAPSERCVMRSDAEGGFWFKAIKPVSYPIPHDGPVGKLLDKLGRHCWRPAHLHFMFEKAGWDHLITWVEPSLHLLPAKVVSISSFLSRLKSWYIGPCTSAVILTRHQTPSSVSSRVSWWIWKRPLPRTPPSMEFKRAPIYSSTILSL